jgi:hypothetical protein
MTKYSVNGIKSFIGMEGHGFNANLLADGKKVCFVIDGAQGGEYDFQWLDFKAEKVDVTVVRFDGTPFTRKGTPNEKAFYDYLASLPKVYCDYFKEDRATSDESFVCNLVTEWETTRDFKRKCKKKTLVKLHSHKKGEYIAWNYPYDAEMKAHVTKEHGADLKEIINERYI